jgi:hypothetical protein
MAEMKNFGKVKSVKPKESGKMDADYDSKMSEMDYPGTKGIATPIEGKQQVSGFKFSGTY